MDNELVFLLTAYFLPAAAIFLAVVFPRRKRVWATFAGAAVLFLSAIILQTYGDGPSGTHVDLWPYLRLMGLISLLIAVSLGIAVQATGFGAYLRSKHWMLLLLAAIPTSILSVVAGSHLSFAVSSY